LVKIRRRGRPRPRRRILTDYFNSYNFS